MIQAVLALFLVSRSRAYKSVISTLLIVVFGAHPASAEAELTIATWNMEWLSDKGDVLQSERSADDYLMMKAVFSVIDADALAFQEVDSLDVLENVIDPSQYDVYLSDRAALLKNSRRSQQFTGWAVRKGLNVIDRKDYRPLGLPTFFSAGSLRYGAYIELERDGEPPLHLLSVHLKSGCFETPVRRNNSCKKLEHQVEALIVWIQTRLNLGQEFVIAGDFNHYLNDSNEWVWDRITREIGEENLVKLTDNTQAKCKARKYNYRTKQWEHLVYNKLIDHIVASKGAVRLSAPPQAKQFQYSYHSVANYRLSDHCPITVNL